MDSEQVDPTVLQQQSIYNRRKYFLGMQRLLDMQLKYQLQILKNTNIKVEMPKIPEINVVPIAASENDILDKKSHQDFINKLKEHTRALEIINRTKNCPISQLMDKL